VSNQSRREYSGVAAERPLSLAVILDQTNRELSVASQSTVLQLGFDTKEEPRLGREFKMNYAEVTSSAKEQLHFIFNGGAARSTSAMS